ncbi:hypothetical protein JAAARDRAFT_42021 [Jaapia argillacea MUCL 33604]|uniref:Mucoidy inhibitor A n=1 Tax=Jaapia argillacea MUCL 33604 TaxID=933084 RepID=A0A067P6I8_9AGAM|nr:hypothetical protein JAAARDRAFT_42021 [Jaapia argillacea MUCL 33604]
MVSVTNIKASDHPVKAVTVFKSSKAEVLRTFSLDLQPGQNKIQITGLPSSIDTESARISGLGDARLFDVVCTLTPPKPLSQSASQSTTHHALQTQKLALEAERKVRTQESDILLAYGETLKAQDVPPEQLLSFLSKFVELGLANKKAVAEIDRKILEVQKEIDKETKKVPEKKGATNGEVTVVIVSENGGHLDLKLTYIVGNVNWEPTYDLHAITEKGKPPSSITLQYRGRVIQSTGEDWTDTSLTLSTSSSDTTSQKVPELEVVKLQQRRQWYGSSNLLSVQKKTRMSMAPGGGPPAPPPPPPMASMAAPQSQLVGVLRSASFKSKSRRQETDGYADRDRERDRERSVGGAGGSVMDDSWADESVAGADETATIGPLAETTAVVSVSPLSISYTVEGEASIPSDGEAHQVSIATLSFDSKVSIVTVPRVNPVAYLQAEIKNTSDYRLLPGPVSVFLDESFMSKTSIQDIPAGDTFTCTLGIDSALRVSYSRKSRTLKDSSNAFFGAFSEQFTTTGYTVLTTIENKHTFDIEGDLVVRDIIPVTEDKQVKVVLRKPEGLAEAKEGEVVVVGSAAGGKGKEKEGGEGREGNGNGNVKVRWSKVKAGRGGEKEGKFEWICAVKAGEEITLMTRYEVKAPADDQYEESW